jgi:GDPmannose 4,6-dehydratase
MNEKAFAEDGKCIIAIDPTYFRPTEVETLLGDATKAKEKLGWVPKINFHALVKEMVHADLKSAERESFIKNNGFEI